jgi:endonuclease VIII
LPEGDTIHRAAGTLHRALAGRTVVRFESALPGLTRVHEDAPLTRRTVEKVVSVGKHLLMHFSGGLVLRTHMRMNGSWHIYRPGERWQRAHRDMRVVIATEDYEAVGFNIPVAEFIRAADLNRHDVLRRLGPDVADPEFDAAEAIHRMRQQQDLEIGAALLNQRVLAGLGNVYKSEVLFVSCVNPFTLVDRLDDGHLSRVVAIAHRLLRANVDPSMTKRGGRRTTGRDNPREHLWVYGRARQPCRRCGTSIHARKQGTDARLTYWCPTCQPS